MNLLVPLRSWSLRKPEERALGCGDRHVSWGELLPRADGIARELARRGVVPGDRVAILGQISIDWCLTALGALAAGAVLVPLNERLRPGEHLEILADTRPGLVVADASTAPAVLEAGTGLALSGIPFLPMAELVSAPPGEAPPEVLEAPSGLAAIMFTSGSTGHPKGVLYSHGSMIGGFTEWAIQEPQLLRARVLNFSALSFTAGLLNGFLGPLVLGGEVVLLPRWDPGQALALIEGRSVTAISGSPIFYEQMAAHPAFRTTDLSSLDFAVTGGAPVSATLLEAWLDRDIPLRQVYGLTESSAWVTIADPDTATKHPEGAGLGGVLTEVRVVDDDGRTCGPGEPGEIVVRGPGVAVGYWQDHEEATYAFRDGWLHTGDIGTFDPTVGLRVVGRKKDVIISGGINIYAAELERVILEMDDVDEVAVIGVPDQQYGETPAALVFGARPPTAEDVVAFCRRRIASYKAPRYVVVLAEPMPRTSGGKVAKGEVRAACTERVLASPRFGEAP